MNREVCQKLKSLKEDKKWLLSAPPPLYSDLFGFRNKIFTKRSREKLYPVISRGSIALQNKRVFFTDTERFENWSAYRDVSVYEKGRVRRLTRGKRIHFIDYNSVLKRFVYVQVDSNEYSLKMSSAHKGFDNEEILINRSGIQLGSPRISPDGEKIAFGFHDQYGFHQIALIELKKKKITQLTNGSVNHVHPAWYPLVPESVNGRLSLKKKQPAHH